MECWSSSVWLLSWLLLLGGASFLLQQTWFSCCSYGRYSQPRGRFCPSRAAWFLQEVPAFLLPLLLLLLTKQEVPEPDSGAGRSCRDPGRTLLVWTFMMHYFHRSFIYAFLTRGRPVPLFVVVSAATFCTLNGALQGHFLLHCACFHDTWLTNIRLTAGFLVFAVGMIINVHSDHILRGLRRPGDLVYRVPHGGMFEFVSGANFLGEVIEWSGYALAVWSLPAFAFAFFTICSIGPRACHHHRDYQKRFKEYPRSRKALIPFLL